MVSVAKETTNSADLVPFIAAGTLLVLTPFFSILLERTTKKFYQGIIDKNPVSRNLKNELQPDRIAKYALYIVDAYQAIAVLLIPTIGILVVRSSHGHDFKLWQVILAIFVVFLGFLPFVFMLACDVDPVSYFFYFSYKGFSVVTVLGIVANGVGAWLVHSYP